MVTRKGYTTITLSKPLKERLDALKAHPRQTYEELITKILDERAAPLPPEEYARKLGTAPDKRAVCDISVNSGLRKDEKP